MKLNFNEVIKTVYSKGVKEDEKYMKLSDFMSTKADELNHTTNTGYGEEFVVPVMLATRVIERVRDKDNLFSEIKNVIPNMPSNPYRIPVAGDEGQMYLSEEETGIPGVGFETVKVVTKYLEMKAFKIGRINYVSTEMLEDSVVNFMNYIENQMADAFETSVHNIIINWDPETAANSNINVIDGTPTGNEDYLGIYSAGLRKVALRSGKFVDAGTLELADIRKARAEMGIKGIDPSKLRAVMDYETYMQLLGLTQAETIEKFGQSATVVNWVLSAIDGIKIVVRKEVNKTNATGEISTNDANNTQGQIILVHIDSVHVAFKRAFSIKTAEDTIYDRYNVSASSRIAVEVSEENGWFPAVVIGNINL